MKVLFISEGYSIGGTSRVMSRLAEIFTDNDIKVDVLIPNYRFQESPSLTEKAILYYISKDENRKNRFFLGLDLILFTFKLIKLSRENNYDYIISFWNYVNLLLILTPVPKVTKKIICSHISFTSLKPHWKILTRLIYPFADGVVVLNKREQNIFAKYCNPVILIENPIPKF